MFEDLCLTGKRPILNLFEFTDEPVFRSLGLLEGDGWIDRYVHKLVLEDVMNSALRSPTSLIARNMEGKIVGKCSISKKQKTKRNLYIGQFFSYFLIYMVEKKSRYFSFDVQTLDFFIYIDGSCAVVVWVLAKVLN